MKWLDNLLGKTRNKTKIPDSEEELLLEVLHEAVKWIGICELKGKPGIGVDTFRKAVDGVANGEPWCAAFVQYCVSAVALRYGQDIAMYPSELCTSIWDNTPEIQRLTYPIPGCIVIWKYPGSIQGHTGIVVKRLENGRLKTIEGNTSHPNMPPRTRGVFPKVRAYPNPEGFELVGFLYPFTRGM